MGLRQYETKRNFTRTPEPQAKTHKAKKGALRFVVQEHHARRLHYDFRLELDGTLKSWAVPKGPSSDPHDKRLAMQVEDHPYSYRTFEGTIPKGNYGAGTVTIWDEGTYHALNASTRAESEKALRHGLQKGHLSFVLEGEKLHGEFNLIRMHGKQDGAWLLIKKEGALAEGEEIRERPFPADSKLVNPMLATLVEEPFSRAGWIFEIKWDGYRAIGDVSKRGVLLYSRNHKNFSEKFASIAQALSSMDRDLLLDGEIVAVDEEGRASFQLLQNYQRTGEGQLVYYVFDILRLDGKDIRTLPLLERKALLKKALPDLLNIRVSDHIEETGEKFFKLIRKQELEGMIAKNGASPYLEGQRSEEWLKVKTHLRQEVIIAGFTEPRGTRSEFGALILGMYEKGKLNYVGHTGTGFNHATLKSLSTKLKPLITGTCPFAKRPITNMPPTWIKPKLVCEVSFTEWTGDGHLRHPVFEGLRVDKTAKQVHREVPGPLPEVTNEKVTITHPDKIYWPREKITKGDLLAYYREIAPLILPYLKDRPESLHRHPNGITGQAFFQKNAGPQIPDWIETVKIHSESGDKDVEFVLCQNAETLLYLANLGCIEFNPWNSRVGSLECPDWVVIDLDPEGIAFSKVIETARTIHALLEKLQIESFCKTSGATGLHIYIPLGAQHDYDRARQFAEIIANVVQRKLPKTTSVTRMPKNRQHRIYLDFLQNRHGQTLAAPYCVRPRPGATVSTPLEWKEVKKGLDPTKFTIRTIAKRLDKKGDLFKPVLKGKTNLVDALDRLERLLK